MTSSWPMMIFRSSTRIFSRPTFMRSASARSSGDSRSTTFTGAFITTLSLIRCSFDGSNLTGLPRHVDDELFELAGVFRRVHAVFQQTQRLDAALQVSPLHVEGAQLRI